MYLLLIIVVLLYLSAFFSSAETAMTAVNRHRLRTLADDGNARAKLVLKILEHQNKMLTAILIGNNIVNLSASALTTVLTSRFGGHAVAIGTGVLTFIVLLFGEITPKTMATLRSEKLALRYAKPVSWCMTVLTPLIFVIGKLSRVLMRIRRIDPDKRDDSMTEDELRTIVEVSHEEGVIESDEKEMINNVVDLGDSQVCDVMVPRVDVVFVDVDASYEELMDVFREERFTRLPVYEDSPDHVIGIMNMKDLILYDHSSEFSIRKFMREPYYTHEFKNTNELFREMRHDRITMSIVLDEYGDTVGIITVEDIVEEIVGDIRDEYDEQELMELQKISDREYLVEGSYKLDDLNDRIGTHLESEDYDSIGGYMIGLLDHFPDPGESCTGQGNVRLVAEKVESNHIEYVRIYLPDPDEAEDEDPEGAIEAGE